MLRAAGLLLLLCSCSSDPPGPPPKSSSEKCAELCKSQGSRVSKYELDQAWGSWKCECAGVAER